LYAPMRLGGVVEAPEEVCVGEGCGGPGSVAGDAGIEGRGWDAKMGQCSVGCEDSGVEGRACLGADEWV
jgi:hypothetical protein